MLTPGAPLRGRTMTRFRRRTFTSPLAPLSRMAYGCSVQPPPRGSGTVTEDDFELAAAGTIPTDARASLIICVSRRFSAGRPAAVAYRSKSLYWSNSAFDACAYVGFFC